MGKLPDCSLPGSMACGGGGPKVLTGSSPTGYDAFARNSTFLETVVSGVLPVHRASARESLR